MDLTAGGVTDILASHSDDRGSTWSTPAPVTDSLLNLDRLYPWISMDAVNGSVNISFYDTLNTLLGRDI
jgi:hypothetical protein